MSMPDFTISDLKRALVEVREICGSTLDCLDCPFKKGKEKCPLTFKLPIGWSPIHWDIDDWKEDGKDATEGKHETR